MKTETSPWVGDLQKTELNDPVRLYKSSIPNVPPNTLEQDLNIGKNIFIMREAQRKAQEAHNLHPEIKMTKSQSKKFERRMFDGKIAIEKITIPCLGLVIEIAAKYFRPGFGKPLIELIEIGNLGLAKAAYRYDYKKGNKFSTYAHWAISRTIKSSFREDDLIPLSHNLAYERSGIDRAAKDFELINGHQPKDEELATISETSVEKIALINKQRKMQPISIDAELGNADGLYLSDLLEDKDLPSLEHFAERAILKKIIEKACILGNLTEREIKVLSLRYGFNEDQASFLLKEVGEKIKNEKTGGQISKERISQNELAAIKKLKNTIKIRDIEEYL